MRKRYLILSLLGIFFLCSFPFIGLNAQSVWVVEKGATLRAASSDTLGVSDFRVLYDYRFMPDTLARDNFDAFTTILQISKTGLSSYTDYHHYRRDSISISYTKNGRIEAEKSNEATRMAGKVYDSNVFFKNYPEKGKLMFCGFALIDKYTYTEELPEFEWEVLPAEKLEIMGYPCHKARGVFAGRTWNVWFTDDIPVSDGPWKLNGLPGLVLKAEDDRGEFFFTAKSIENIRSAIFVQSLADCFKSTKAQYQAAYERGLKNGRAVLRNSGKITVSGGKAANTSVGKPYNPIERE